MRDYEEKSYYEIQLDNKQLILVFLAGLVLCVLVFVLGVMVGKGQKEAEMASITTARPEPQVAKSEPDIKPPQQAKQNLQAEEKVPPVSKPAVKGEKPQKKEAAAPSSKARSATAKEEYSFYDLDKKDTQANADLEKPAAKPAPASKPAVSQKPAATEKTDQSSNGIAYTVQIMATASKEKADAQVTSLRARGYKPFLDEFKTQGGVVYKVRVGKFNDSAGARELAARLKQDMKLETWVAVLD